MGDAIFTVSIDWFWTDFQEIRSPRTASIQTRNRRLYIQQEQAAAPWSCSSKVENGPPIGY